MLPAWVWVVAHTVGVLSAHPLNLYQSRVLLWDRLLARKKSSVWCFIEHYGVGIFFRGLVQQALWALPSGVFVVLICNFWDVSVPMSSFSVMQMVVLGMCVGVMRTPRENALVASQLHQRPALSNTPATWASAFRGAPLTLLCDVCFFVALHQAGLGTFGEGGFAPSQLQLPDLAWYLLPVMLAMGAATALTNALDVIRARVVCALNTEVIDLTDLLGQPQPAAEAQERITWSQALRTELHYEAGIFLWNAQLFLRGMRCCRGSTDAEVIFSSPNERVCKPSALWLGLVQRLLYNEILLVVTVVWASFIGSVS